MLTVLKFAEWIFFIQTDGAAVTSAHKEEILA
jgi:hypothetical protein